MGSFNRIIAIAEDDPDDRDLTRDAFVDGKIDRPLMFFNDGAELMDYLRDAVAASDDDMGLPSIVLMDLNMPRLDGRQALSAIRADPSLRHLPVIVMSTSRAEHDICDAYQRGANSFISKPPRFNQLVETLKALDQFWFHAAMLPSPAQNQRH